MLEIRIDLLDESPARNFGSIHGTALGCRSMPYIVLKPLRIGLGLRQKHRHRATINTKLLRYFVGSRIASSIIVSVNSGRITERRDTPAIGHWTLALPFIYG